MTTRELGRSLDAEFAASTPSSAITGDAIIHKGRKVRRHRRLALAGTGAAVVAAAVAVALAVPGVMSEGGTDDSGPIGEAVVEQPAFPLPELDPDKGYYWMPLVSGSAPTDETRTLDAAYREHMATLIDGLVTSDLKPMQRYERGIESQAVDDAEGNNELLPYSAPLYYGGGAAVRSEDGEHQDTVTVEVSAKGSFLPGPGQPFGANGGAPAPYLVPGCEDYSYNGHGIEENRLSVDFECSTSTGPDGEQVLSVTHLLRAAGGELRSVRQYVVVYRLDGTAIVVTDNLEAIGQEVADLRGVEPGLSEQDLLALALAMPDVVVR